MVTTMRLRGPGAARLTGQARPGTLAGSRARGRCRVWAGRGASSGRCGGGPAGGQCPVQEHGCGGREQGGAEGDQGDLPARHATGGDDADGGSRDRRDADGLVLPARPRDRDGPGEGGRDDGGRGQQAAGSRGQDGGEPPQPRAGLPRLPWTDGVPGGEGVRTWVSPVCSELAGTIRPSIGSTVAGVPGDHHTCRPTAGPTGLRRGAGGRCMLGGEVRTLAQPGWARYAGSPTGSEGSFIPASGVARPAGGGEGEPAGRSEAAAGLGTPLGGRGRCR